MTHTRFLPLAAVLLLTSCYKLFSTMAPEEVAPGETFEVSFTVVDDGSSTQNFVTDWSYAGIRVPKGWTVTVPKGAHQQFAEDWVYYSDGSQVRSNHDMEESTKLSGFYNSACPRSGYTWTAFQSCKKIPKNISACWRNGCDSIRVTFLVTVPEATTPGKYYIDFMGGDEEDDAGLGKYNAYTDAKGSRLFHVSTVPSTYVDNQATALRRTVVVLDPDHVTKVDAERDETPAYDLSGRPAASNSSIIIKKGKKTVKQ